MFEHHFCRIYQPQEKAYLQLQSCGQLPPRMLHLTVMKSTGILLPLVFLIISTLAFGQRIEPYQGSRIFWDLDSQRTIFSPGTYARLIQLKDGRLMAVADQRGISVSYSSDLGNTWTSPQHLIPSTNEYSNTNAEVIQLPDGTLLIGYNARPKQPYSEDRKFSIWVVRSTDNGLTWSEPIFVFAANHLFIDGCWEPAFLVLPNREIQCYFANEGPYTSNDHQEISMCHSGDLGQTWSPPVTVCYREGSRDGMPVAILVNDPDEIVVIIEDNGWQGRGNFAATTVRTTLEDNWKKKHVDASDERREMIFQTIPDTNIYSAAPYLRKLPWGETVATYQSNEDRASNDLQYADMYVLVGDKRARNFKAKSAPFALPLDRKAIWNSVSVLDSGTVVAIASIGPPNRGERIEMIKGYPIRQAKAAYGTITVDGIRNPDEKWTTENANQFPMGHVTKNMTSFDLLYDENYLYLISSVRDKDIVKDTENNDGVRFFIDVDDVSGTIPQMGMYRFFFDTNGTVAFAYGEEGAYKESTNTTCIQYSIDTQSEYYNFESAIPWNVFGKTAPPITKRMAIAVEIVNRQTEGVLIERISDIDTNASWTWLEFKLNPRVEADIKILHHP